MDTEKSITHGRPPIPPKLAFGLMGFVSLGLTLQGLLKILQEVFGRLYADGEPYEGI